MMKGTVIDGRDSHRVKETLKCTTSLNRRPLPNADVDVESTAVRHPELEDGTVRRQARRAPAGRNVKPPRTLGQTRQASLQRGTIEHFLDQHEHTVGRTTSGSSAVAVFGRAAPYGVGRDSDKRVRINDVVQLSSRHVPVGRMGEAEFVVGKRDPIQMFAWWRLARGHTTAAGSRRQRRA